MKLVAGLVAAAVAFAPGNAAGGGLTDEEAALQIHGFASQGALLTSDNNYLATTERGSLEFTEAGINLTKRLDERLRIGFQLFARDLGPEGNYSAKLDWFGLDYHWRDWLGIRAGRNKLPFGLYNDTSDIDAAQTVVLLPNSIYPATNREVLLAQTGVELYGYRRFDDAGALDYRAYFGTVYISLPASSPGVKVDSFEVPYVTGARVLWETPLEGLRVGPTLLSGRVDTKYTVTGMPQMAFDLRVTNLMLSAEYATGPFTFAAEVLRSYSKVVEGPPTPIDIGEGGYGLAGYRVSEVLQTTLYYSIAYPDVDKRVGRESHLHDAAACLRFDVSPHLLVKLEGHAMRGTAGLSPALNDNVQPAGLVNKWYLAAAKVTAYF